MILKQASSKEQIKICTRTKEQPRMPHKLLPFLWYFIKKQQKNFLIIQFCCLALVLDRIAWPYVTQMIVDAVFGGEKDGVRDWKLLIAPLITWLVLWVTIDIMFEFVREYQRKAMPKLEADIRTEVFRHASHHSHAYLLNNFPGTVGNKVADITRSSSSIVMLVVEEINPVAIMILIAIGLFATTYPVFALMLSIWLIIHFGISALTSIKCNQNAEAHSEAKSALQGRIVDTLVNHLAARVFNGRGNEQKTLGVLQDDEKKKHREHLQYLIVVKRWLVIFDTSFMILMACTSAYIWHTGGITAGGLVFILNASFNLIIVVWSAGTELPTLFKEVGTCNQALSIIKDGGGAYEHISKPPLRMQEGLIEFRGVNFSYHHSIQNTLLDINLRIEPGEKIGVVGYTGAGKSTFVGLLLRLFNPNDGQILIDSQDIIKVRPGTVRNHIAFIPQDTTLFHRTIKENIAYGDPSAIDKEIHEAAGKAHIHEFIMSLPQEYDTIVGERGVKLSGGQRQRIMIARAILKEAPILILDEATSQLDSITEGKIQESLKEAMTDKTVIAIAHRLSTLSNMDRLVVFNDGRIVEQGTHCDLLGIDNGHYRTMWEKQAGGFLGTVEGEG
jgi:ATP-binding cassette subfamily B protein